MRKSIDQRLYSDLIASYKNTMTNKKVTALGLTNTFARNDHQLRVLCFVWVCVLSPRDNSVASGDIELWNHSEELELHLSPIDEKQK